MSGERVFTTMKMKEKIDGHSSSAENRPSGDGSDFYAIIDHAIYGDEFWIGSLDDVSAELGTYGDGIIFCRLRIFTVH